MVGDWQAPPRVAKGATLPREVMALVVSGMLNKQVGGAFAVGGFDASITFELAYVLADAGDATGQSDRRSRRTDCFGGDAQPTPAGN